MMGMVPRNISHSVAAQAVGSLSRLRGRVGEGVSLLESLCLPPPYPSPASGGGDAVAQSRFQFAKVAN
jgi:hypothetical protein